MAVAAFDYQAWQFRFPELAPSVPQGMASAYFAEAGLYLDNSDASVVSDVGQRGLILNMIVAHLALLNAALNGQPVSTLAGRITGASEGSVSVTLASSALPNTAEWWAQTRPGLSAWQALAPYRTMRYLPGPGALRRFGGFPCRLM
jgi:hypothetical protein